VLVNIISCDLHRVASCSCTAGLISMKCCDIACLVSEGDQIGELECQLFGYILGYFIFNISYDPSDDCLVCRIGAGFSYCYALKQELGATC
jgi:hypothetical protein